MIQNKHKLAFLLCLLLMATTAFGASEAEYKNWQRPGRSMPTAARNSVITWN